MCVNKIKSIGFVINSYYRGAVGAVLVYDTAKERSFHNAKKWLSEIREHADPNIVIILVGNKIDLCDLRVVEQEKAITFAKENNMLYVETSALDTTNVKGAFESLIKGMKYFNCH